MKKFEQIKKNNKGFSLVELIVVIAIMIVLVAVLAPVFTKYVEQSRRATDVQNANTIASAILVDMANSDSATSTTDATEVVATDSIKSVPDVKGNVGDGKKFYYEYDASANTVKVYVGNSTNKTWSKDLTSETNAKSYKNDGKTFTSK